MTIVFDVNDGKRGSVARLRSVLRVTGALREPVLYSAAAIEVRFNPAVPVLFDLASLSTRMRSTLVVPTGFVAFYRPGPGQSLVGALPKEEFFAALNRGAL